MGNPTTGAIKPKSLTLGAIRGIHDVISGPRPWNLIYSGYPAPASKMAVSEVFCSVKSFNICIFWKFLIFDSLWRHNRGKIADFCCFWLKSGCIFNLGWAWCLESFGSILGEKDHCGSAPGSHKFKSVSFGPIWGLLMTSCPVLRGSNCFIYKVWLPVP